MTQTTTALLEPDDDFPICTAGLPWCNGECPMWDNLHHTSGFDSLTVVRHGQGEFDLSVSVAQEVEDGALGPARIYMLGAADEVVLTPERARRLAALLLNAADDTEGTR